MTDPTRTDASRRALAGSSASETWRPFDRVHYIAIGGLWAVGMVGEVLLVVSAQGRGVFDLTTPELDRVARDYELVFDDNSGVVGGIGPLVGISVPVDGSGGGFETAHRLPQTTHDDDTLVIDTAHGSVVLRSPDGTKRELGPFEEIRAAGFSESGRSLLVAEQHTLHIWRR